MRALRYLFVGNRIQVLHEMLRLGLKVEVLPLPKTKKALVREIELRKFDVLVSNGCPFILPISKLQKRNQLFINIHPSLLPDLKGKSPILEAIKQNKPMGVTCHHMIDEVDSGPIVFQIKVDPNRKDLNECYRTCFKAEGEVFKKAYQRHFKPL